MKKAFPDYSVLMSVYFKERSEFLRESMMSIWRQSQASNDFVFICDGAVTEELDATIEEMQQLFGKVLIVHRLEKNGGLGKALKSTQGIDKRGVTASKSLHRDHTYEGRR